MNNYEIINTMKLLFKRKLKEEVSLSPIFFEKHKSWVLASVPILHPEIEEMDQVTVNTLYATAKNEWLSTIHVGINPGGVLVKPGYLGWLSPERKESIVWNYTNRYLGMLKKTGRSEKVIAEVDRSSDEILEKLGDPRSEKDFFYRGLVVGNVQSGKTANFNAVINKAIDAGYSLIIILSGIMEDLRSQTQQRIDNDVVGEGILDKAGGRKGPKGVGLERVFGEQGGGGIHQVTPITSYKSDFNKNAKELDFTLNNKNILVCKKNTGVLKNLLIWLSEYLQENKDKHSIPLLIIDDEADNASLNNLGYKGRAYASTINGHIRALLGLFSRKSYLGYTATPFANVLQDRNPPSKEKWPITYRHNGELVRKEFAQAESIFPDDFIQLLTPPSNYIGAKHIFETVLDDTIKKLPLLVQVDDTPSQFPQEIDERAPVKEDPFPEELPLSLREAVQCFVLSIAVRLSRKTEMINSRLYNPHHTMLIHVSRFITWQNRTRALLADYLRTLESRILNELPGAGHSVYRELEQIWNKYFASVVTDIRSYLPDGYQDEFLIRKTYADIQPLLIEAIKGIEIKAVNSVIKDQLEYTEDVNRNGKKYIAVGGNRLSRGFTLEGLTINYFIRNTNYSDTLMQMGRWFGYRPGYIDCCKLFTTSDAIEKFDSTTRAIEELELEFLKMDREGRSPGDYLIRVKKHPGALKITRPAILKNTTQVDWSYQDKLEQTTKFILNPGSIRSAWEDFTGFVKKYESRFIRENGFYLLRTDHKTLLEMLALENTFYNYGNDLNQIKKFIDRCIEQNKLKNWTIAIKASGNARDIQSLQKDFPFSIRMAERRGPADNKKHQKDLVIIRRLIDINFMYDVTVSQGNREPLTVDFGGYYVECIQAAMEKNYESWLCVLPAPLLAELYKKHSSRMLEKNVRSFLQLNNSVNRGIQDTIRNSPEKFIAYNNGLTITATGKDFITENDKTYIQTLTDFQIVNGGQTTATIYFSNKSGLDISKVRVMAKINVAKDSSQEELEDLITKISAYSNAQSKVSSVDLRSRNSQLVKLKTLSESVLTPSGKKWYFERARGEFNTMVRKNPGNKSKLDKESPKERRFTKEELAKYVTAWGENPYLVKKGGEKVFRLFIEEISGEGRPQKEVQIDRTFYEETIAKVILFRTLEKLHGSGPQAIGQLRSAVVPYSISILHKFTTGDRENAPFRLTEIWKKEGLDDQLTEVARDLMVLVNDLIKEYSASDDYGEYSKKPELWNKIRSCREIADFVEDAPFQGVIRLYCGNGKTAKNKPAPKKGRDRPSKELPEVDFSPAYDAIRSTTRAGSKDQKSYMKALNFIISTYQFTIENKKNLLSEFTALRKIAAVQGAHYSTVFPRIGSQLNQGFPPDIDMIVKVAGYTDLI
ncbi:MAG TPA: AIPR family protein [Puia sp.]|jgi:hypothetical protein